MASTKVANAYILITPKFDNLGKNTEKAMKEAARIGAAAFKSEFQNVAVDIVSDFKDIVTRGTVTASYMAGIKSAKAFNTTFNEGIKANNKISVVLEKDTVEAATNAGEKGSIKLAQALSDSSAKVSKESSKLGKLISSGILRQIGSASSSVGNAGVRIGTSIISGIKTGLSRGASTIKSLFASIIPNGKSYGLNFSKQFLTGFRSGGVVAGITSAFAYTGIFSAISGVEEATSSAISRVDTLNNYPKVMQALGYSSEEATASISKMESALDGLPTSLDEMATVVSGYTAALGDIGQATDVGLALNNMMLAGGTGTEMVNTALEQFRQILSKGKPDLQDWKSLLNAASGQMKQLAQYMLGTDSVDELYSYIGGGVDDDTYKENIDTYQSHMQEFLSAIVELNANGSDSITSFQEQAYAATKGISTSIQLIKTRATKAVSSVLQEIGQENISGVLTDISEAELSAGHYFAAMVSGMKQTLDYDAVREMVSIYTDFAGILKTDKETAVEYGKSLGQLTNKLVQLDIKTAPVFKSIATAVKNIVKWMTNNSIAFLASMVNTLASNATVLDKAVTSVGQAIEKAFPSDGSGSVKWGEAFGDAIVIIAENIPTLVDRLTELKDKFSQTFTLPNTSDFTNALQKVLTFATDLIDGFTKTIDFNEFKTMFSTYANILGDTFNGLFNTDDMSIGQMFGAMLATMANNTAKLATAMAPLVEIFSGYFIEGIQWLRDNLPGIVTSIQQFFDGFSNTIDFDILTDAVTTFAGSLADGLGVNSDLSDAERNGVAFATVLNDMFIILQKIAPYGEAFGKIIKYIAENIEWLVPTVLALIVACKGVGALTSVITTISTIKGMFGSGSAAKAVSSTDWTSAYNLDEAVYSAEKANSSNTSFDEFFSNTSTKKGTEGINFAEKEESQSIFQKIQSKFDELIENIKTKFTEFTTNAKTKVTEFATSVGDNFKNNFSPKIDEAVENTKTKFSTLSESVKTTFTNIGENIKTAFEDVGKKAVEGISKAFTGLGEKAGETSLGESLTNIGEKLSGEGGLEVAKGAAKVAGKDALSIVGLGSLVYDVADFLQQIFDNMFGEGNLLSNTMEFLKINTWLEKKITDLIWDIIFGFADVMTHLGDWLTAIPRAICDQLGILDYDLGNLPEDIKNGFTSFFNSIGDALTGALDSAKSGLEGFFGDAGNWVSENIHLPQFANGGVVTGPTLSLIGEGNSNEAVLPLNNSTYDNLAKNISSRQSTAAGSNDDLLNGIKDLIGSMQINLDGKTLGRVSAPYNDRALGSRSRLAARGVAI